MTKYVTIEDWTEIGRIQSNRPNRWQKLIAHLKFGTLPIPKYWIAAIITVHYPHSLKIGDIILTRELQQYIVMDKMYSSALYTERFRVSSIEPMEQSTPELGKVIIMGQVYSEMNPNTEPFGGQVL
jgi:hypothetical protein